MTSAKTNNNPHVVLHPQYVQAPGPHLAIATSTTTRTTSIHAVQQVHPESLSARCRRPTTRSRPRPRLSGPPRPRQSACRSSSRPRSRSPTIRTGTRKICCWTTRMASAALPQPRPRSTADEMPRWQQSQALHICWHDADQSAN